MAFGELNNIFEDSFNKILPKQLTHDCIYRICHDLTVEIELY